MSFSIVFKLYQDNGWMIMIGCEQWNPVYSSRAHTRDHYISTPVLTPLSFWSSSITGIRTNRVHAYDINWKHISSILLLANILIFSKIVLFV